MKRTILLIVLFILCFAPVAFAQPHDVDSSQLTNFYNVIQKLELSKDGGLTWFTVFDNNTTQVDLVALSGQNVGTILGSNNLPAGYYDSLRATIASAGVVIHLTCSNGHAQETYDYSENFSTGPNGESFPITFTDDVGFTVSEGGTTNCVMNFDAATSFSGTFQHNPGGNPEWYPTEFNFDPQIEGVE